MTDDELIEMAKAHGIDATRLSTVVGFARAVERAARAAAIEECISAVRSVPWDEAEDAIRVLREGK
jgi:post-segregation antitoxin (ccd killing protein)